MIGIELVLLARIAVASVTTLSSARNTSTFDASSSITASTTSWRSASSSRSVVTRIRPRASSRASSVSLPERTPRSSDVVRRASPASAAPASTSRTTTSRPARAHTSAMPDPIRPLPTTPTRSIALITADGTGRGPTPGPLAGRGMMGAWVTATTTAHGRSRTGSTRGASPTACTTCSGRSGRWRTSARSSRRRRCSSWRPPTARATRSARTRAARRASCRSSPRWSCASRATTATGCSCRSATCWRTRTSRCCSSTSSSRTGSGCRAGPPSPRIRALVGRYPGALFAIHVAVDDVFPNCPRYIHRTDGHELSVERPRRRGRGPDRRVEVHADVQRGARRRRPGPCLTSLAAPSSPSPPRSSSAPARTTTTPPRRPTSTAAGDDTDHHEPGHVDIVSAVDVVHHDHHDGTDHRPAAQRPVRPGRHAGDPDATSVVLWTRLIGDALTDDASTSPGRRRPTTSPPWRRQAP